MVAAKFKLSLSMQCVISLTSASTLIAQIKCDRDRAPAWHNTKTGVTTITDTEKLLDEYCEQILEMDNSKHYKQGAFMTCNVK